ncbi:hypothetical protein BIFADO_00242 [Bifidobacterium adolescentis L2-32]|uniref:Uncharacterized protein n=1 Tax=Bifidobacterium adolescentis L2-32 TaxID=411481 RepID=A7A353_BIFAD|nr:hypothetical protein BIFADO_00242 [Bifidobacterium adolescentis L2-32]
MCERLQRNVTDACKITHNIAICKETSRRCGGEVLGNGRHA